MVTETFGQQQGETSTLVDRLRVGPIPPWVAPCSFPADFRGGSSHVTTLLLDRQIHAEKRQTYFHQAVRLETMQAVQEGSPWRMTFAGRGETAALHWIKTWRNGAAVSHSNLDAMRIVENALDHKRETIAVLMLEDIRPGDILEWCYTIDSDPPVLADHCSAMFTLPAAVAIGKFNFSVTFDFTRPMRWKSFDPSFAPAENKGPETTWTWQRENHSVVVPEENLPDWLIPYPWIQISDYPNWRTVAQGFAAAWKPAENDSGIASLAALLPDGMAAREKAEQALQLVQDEFRYIPAADTLEGFEPTTPGLVARRRYGSALDLSHTLAEVLRHLGIPARLVLVSEAFRRSLLELLPAKNIFDHLLVEYAVAGETRWVDATLKPQGGGSLNRVSRDYGAGLPVGAEVTELAPPPKTGGVSNLMEVKENILLDTSGAWSWLAVTVCARGALAESLRQELEAEGVDAFGRERLRQCSERFHEARRIGKLEFRDDRAANEFFLAETFEVKGFLAVDAKSKWYKFESASEYILDALKTPPPGKRVSPFALPYPCGITYTMDLNSVALPPAPVQQRGLATEYFNFTRLRKTLAGNWILVLTVSTLKDCVPPEDLEKHRRSLEEVGKQSFWSLLVPPGDPRPHQRSDFGRLPSTLETSAVIGPAAWRPNLDARKPEEPKVAEDPETDAGDVLMKRRKRVRRKKPQQNVGFWRVAGMIGLGIFLILLAAWVAKNADRFNFLHLQAPPRDDPETMSLRFERNGVPAHFVPVSVSGQDLLVFVENHPHHGRIIGQTGFRT